MRNFVRSCVVVGALLIAQSSFAGILVEPILGYGFGDYKQTGNDGKISGAMFGGRAGLGLGPVIIAADIMTGTNKLKPDGGGAEEDAKMQSLGATVLFSPPVLPLRVWAGYAFSVEAKPDSGGKLEGTGLKVGAGYSAIPFVSVNAEYIMNTFTKLNGTDMGNDLKANVIFLSVSVPLGI